MIHQPSVHFSYTWLCSNGKPSLVRLSATGPDGDLVSEHVTAPPVTASAISEFVDNLCVKYGGIDRAKAELALNSLAQQINAEAELEWIDISETDTRKLAKRAWNAVAERNAKDPVLFRLSNELVRLERNCGEAPQTGQLTKEKLRYQLRRMANFFRVHDGKAVLQDPPARLIEDMLAEPDAPLPMLRTVTDVPIFASDGTLINTPGYHAGSGIYYRPALGLAVPSVPDQPSESDVEKAKRIIDDVLCDFPFAAEADRAHAIGLMLLPFVRELIDGPTPLVLIGAPTYGSGKGLLAQVCLAPGCSELAFLAPGHDDNELRKMITSALLEYKRVLVLDNVTQLRSPVLAMAITASRWQDRLLGLNRVVSFPARCIWVATGNNVQLSGKIMRRCVWIRLLPPCERPWAREPNEFRHPCLIDYVKRHRAKLVWAALTLVQNWLAAGRPSFNERPLGSFEAWSRTVGGILQAAGITGFLENQNEFYETTDEDSLAARCFVQSWWETYQIRPVLAAALVSLAKDCELLPAQSDDAGLARRLGRWLSKNEGRVFSNYRITRAGVHQRAILWQLSPTEGSRPRRSDGDLDTGAGDVDDPFGEDDPLQADGSPLTGDCDSVPASMRGGTNSPNSLNSPISGDTIPGDTNPASELSEFLSPSQKRVLTPTGDNANSGLTDISPCKSKTCAGDIIPGDRNPPLGTGDTIPGDTIPGDTNPAGDTTSGDTNRVGDRNPSLGSGQLTDTERELLVWLRRQSKPVTLRDVQRGLRAMRRQVVAIAALKKLATLDFGEWEPAPSGRRGRAVKRFRLKGEPVTAAPSDTPTVGNTLPVAITTGTETAPALSPLQILDAVYRLPVEWREKYWQLFDAAGRRPLAERSWRAYCQLKATMGNQATPVTVTAPHTEPGRLGNTEIIAEVAKLSSESQRRFWKLYDSYAGRYPRRELLWLAWQSLQDEIRRGAVPIDTALTLDADQTNSEPATPGSAERSQPEQPKSGRELQPVTPDQAIRAKLDALVNQLSPALRKRYWELHSDYCVRRYPYLDARQCAWRDLQLEIERGRISAPEPASASAATAVEPDTPSELPGNASPSPRQELPTAKVENHADMADVIRQCGQVLGAKTIRKGTSPELADILPAETDAELAQLGAEIAKHLEAAENPTEESDTSQIFQAISYSVPQTEAELRARVSRWPADWRKRYWELVADVQALGFPRAKAIWLAWHGIARENYHYRHKTAIAEQGQPNTSGASDDAGDKQSGQEPRAGSEPSLWEV